MQKLFLNQFNKNLRPSTFLKPNATFRPFAARSKKDMPLNAEWTKMASKELRGKDVHETLVRETNEQMLIKPMYTSEDVEKSD